MDNGACSYRRFLNGEEGAFDEIIKELFPSLVFFINGYVHDIHTAEDIAIDVFSELVVHKYRYNFKVTLKTYLFMLGRSRALDCLKHRRVIELTAQEAAEELQEEIGLEERFLADERRRRVHAALALLPSDMREAVHLIYFEEMTYAEAARVMKKSKKQVDNLLYRAKKELRTLLKEDGELLE